MKASPSTLVFDPITRYLNTTLSPFMLIKAFQTTGLVLLMLLSQGIAPPNALAKNEDIQLPDIGDPADTILSPSEEQQLGTIIISQIRSSLNVVDDPELDAYVQSLGTRLISAGLDSNIEFTFLLLADPAINAFAAPGGIIAINTGLMLASENESELAGVVAHEIAHIKQRHLARAYANASKINLATALGVLAAIAGGIYNPALGSAALQTTIAAGAQAQLAFSRANEQEADRIGLMLLANAGFDPMGMPHFFERLHKRTQLNSGPILEFLSTHPVTLSRISDTKSRAVQYEGPFVNDSISFQYAKARARALTATPASITATYENAIQKGRIPAPTDRYSYAVAITRSGNALKAVNLLSRLKKEKNDSLFIDLALAQAYIAAGKYSLAHNLLTRLDQIYPNQEVILYYLAKCQIDMNTPREALSTIAKLPQRERQSPRIDTLRAKAASKANLPWISHEAMANYYMAYGQYGAAMEQLELALRQTNIDGITQARIRSKRKALRELKKQD
jgi:predicted Zn-dependent protease